MIISVSCHIWNEKTRADNCKLSRAYADGEDIISSNQTNLAIKGIIAIGAMSKMSLFAGKYADADRYSVCINLSDTIQYSEIDQAIEYNRTPLRWMENGRVRQWPAPPRDIWRLGQVVDIRLQSICW